MVQQYWNLALRHKYHPLRRLVFGLFEVFTGSYGTIGIHRAVCKQAVCELRSIHLKIYSVMRLLFSSLPHTYEMFAPISICIDNNLTSKNIDLNCADLDRRHWERVIYLNAFTDVKLLTYLEINR
ncbi:unnamed protein product [Onchocerca flexuosa]|uniref:Alsin helical array domain-containing protein n=1 Tax=Onchocerca flexuosa TaxID=387005 RepID=A0A183HPS3_9BILA|nr:unnamed protein product [Onchocerca flexuosa]